MMINFSEIDDFIIYHRIYNFRMNSLCNMYIIYVKKVDFVGKTISSKV